MSDEDLKVLHQMKDLARRLRSNICYADINLRRGTYGGCSEYTREAAHQSVMICDMIDDFIEKNETTDTQEET